jgi:hypothetical protein
MPADVRAAPLDVPALGPPMVRSAARPSTAGMVASGARIKPRKPGEAFPREPLRAGGALDPAPYG